MILVQIYVQNVNKDFIYMEEHVKLVHNKIVWDAIILVNVQNVLQDIH